MPLEPGSVLALDPPERIRLRHARDAVAWARSIPDFGWKPEVYALFLDRRQHLRRAIWLGTGTSFDDFAGWPDLALAYAPGGDIASVVFLICRPGHGTAPLPDDRDLWDVVHVAHAVQGVHAADAVFVDGWRWQSLRETLE